MKQALLALLLLVAACGGGGGSGVSAELRSAGQCASLNLGNLNDVFAEVTDFLGAIGGMMPPSVNYSTPPDYAITTSFGTIAGSVTSLDVISDGIDAGEAATASWNVTGGSIGGNGTFTLDRTSTTVFTIGGNGSVVDGTCVINVSNVDLDLDLASSLGPVGSFDFDAVTPGGPMTGTMTFDGSDIAVVEALFLGVLVTFEIDLNTFQPVF